VWQCLAPLSPAHRGRCTPGTTDVSFGSSWLLLPHGSGFWWALRCYRMSARADIPSCSRGPPARGHELFNCLTYRNRVVSMNRNIVCSMRSCKPSYSARSRRSSQICRVGFHLPPPVSSEATKILPEHPRGLHPALHTCTRCVPRTVASPQ